MSLSWSMSSLTPFGKSGDCAWAIEAVRIETFSTLATDLTDLSIDSEWGWISRRLAIGGSFACARMELRAGSTSLIVGDGLVEVSATRQPPDS